MTLEELFNKDVDDPTLEPHERELVRKKRLLEKVRVLRDSVLINRGEVKGKDNMHYVWVNQHPERQTWYQSMGYQLCKDPGVETRYKQKDGSHRRGDLVLYEIDKETAEAYHLDSVIRGIEMIEGHSKNFEETLAKAGAPLYRPQLS